MSHNKPFGQASDILTPVADETMAMAAMVEAMRAQTAMVGRVFDKVDNLSGAVAKVREDIAVMQVRDEEVVRLRTTIAAQDSRLRLLEERNLKQDGVVSFGEYIQRWAPWLLAAGAWAWNVFGKH